MQCSTLDTGGGQDNVTLYLEEVLVEDPKDEI
jgi:hypothetical protein